MVVVESVGDGHRAERCNPTRNHSEPGSLSEFTQVKIAPNGMLSDEPGVPLGADARSPT
jgi:hypothetical protein